MPLTKHVLTLEKLYEKYNRRRYVHPDPLEFLYEYDDPADREIVAMIASSLAYGRVAQILRSVRNVLDRMGPRPGEFLRRTSPGKLQKNFADFKHRFHTGDHMAALLTAARTAINRHGSLQKCFTTGLDRLDDTLMPALHRFVSCLNAASAGKCASMLPDPADGSACKRLNLMLRWLIRHDEVDPGGWGDVPPEKLVIPLDTHMHKISLALGLTSRKQADMKTAIEITAAFRAISPNDPVRYDFVLTRFGIRQEMSMQDCLGQFGKETYAYA